MKKHYDEELIKHQSIGEKIADSITHGIGALLSIAALIILVVISSKIGDKWKIVSFSIYGTSLFILYLSSTLYHSLPSGKAQRVFNIFDHAAIYVLIAGSYTPITLISMRGVWGWTLFGLIWGLAILGILYSTFFTGKFKILSTLIYLIMGWLVILAIKPMLRMVPHGMLIWLIIGGLFYSLGVIFYLWKNLRYHHMIWHLFVLAGSASHFIGFLIYLT